MSERWLQLIADPEPWSAPSPLPGPIETERLIVRLPQRGDGPQLFEAVDSTRASLLPWMVWASTDHQTVDDSIHYVERSRREAERPDCKNFGYFVWERATGLLLGSAGLHRMTTGLREVEVGYWIRGDRHGEGLCTEAVGALLSLALRPSAAGGWGFRRIFIQNAVENVGSRRVCEKLGLRLERRMRQGRYVSPEVGGKGYHDMLEFAVLSDEWDAATGRARPHVGWPARLADGLPT